MDGDQECQRLLYDAMRCMTKDGKETRERGGSSGKEHAEQTQVLRGKSIVGNGGNGPVAQAELESTQQAETIPCAIKDYGPGRRATRDSATLCINMQSSEKSSREVATYLIRGISTHKSLPYQSSRVETRRGENIAQARMSTPRYPSLLHLRRRKRKKKRTKSRPPYSYPTGICHPRCPS